MQITDTIADLLTRIRNASTSRHETVDIPASNMKKSIVEILQDEGYIKKFTVIEDGKQGIIRVTLKYDENKKPVITGLKRVSKPTSASRRRLRIIMSLLTNSSISRRKLRLHARERPCWRA